MPGAVAAPDLGRPEGRGWPGPIRRLWVRLNRTRLDRALAGGANPTESVELSLRAGQLIDPSHREQIAASIEALLELAGRERPIYLGITRIPISRRRIDANRVRLQRLARILRSPRPVSPRGVAMARLLMTDFRGPVYTGGRMDRLPEALDATITGLEH